MAAESLNFVRWECVLERPIGMIAIFLVLILAATYCSSLYLFRAKIHRRSGKSPTAPYLIPLIGHTRIFAVGEATLASALQ